MEGLVFAVESFSKAWPDGQKLLPAHWQEVEEDRDQFPLDPHLANYEKLEADGRMIVVTVRNAGTLVGYLGAVLSLHPHTRTSLTAHVALFYLTPEWRKGWFGVELLRYAETVLRKNGVQRIYAACKLKPDLMGLFQRLGWTEIERRFSKVIA